MVKLFTYLLILLPRVLDYLVLIIMVNAINKTGLNLAKKVETSFGLKTFKS